MFVCMPQNDELLRIEVNHLAPSASPRHRTSATFWSPVVIGCLAGGVVILLVIALTLVIGLRRRARHKRLLSFRKDPHLISPTSEATLRSSSDLLPVVASPLRSGMFGPSYLHEPSAKSCDVPGSPGSGNFRKDKVAMNPILSMSKDSGARAASLPGSLCQSTLYRG